MGMRSRHWDQSLQLLLEGYTWMPGLRRSTGSDVVRTRVMGQPTLGLCGPEAAQFFYDEKHVQRHGAIPSPVLSTLFGHGAVHTLDGDAHRRRKSLFLSLVTPDSVASLVSCVAAAWEDTVVGWRADREVVLFDEASRALTAGVRRWAGVPVGTGEVAEWRPTWSRWSTGSPRPAHGTGGPARLANVVKPGSDHWCNRCVTASSTHRTAQHSRSSHDTGMRTVSCWTRTRPRWSC